MRRGPLVEVELRARRAYGVPALLPAGAIVVGAGEVLRVFEDGRVEPVLPGGHPRPGVASDPTARSRRRR